MRYSTPVRLLTVAMLAPLASAADAWPAPTQAPAARPVHWRLTLPALRGRAARRPGRTDTVRLRLAARMDAGWYIYSLTQPPGGPTRSTVVLRAGGPYAQDGDVQAPEPMRHDDPNFGIVTEMYRERVAFLIPSRSTEHPGEVAALVRYQACNDRSCLPPRTDTVLLTLATRPAGPLPKAAVAPSSGRSPPEASATADAVTKTQLAPRSAPAVVPQPASAVAARDTAPSESHRSTTPEPGGAPPGQTILALRAAQGPASAAGSGASPAAFLWLAAVMGLLALLTPCVFPMVPITIAFFTRSGPAANGGGVLADGSASGTGKALQATARTGLGRNADAADAREWVVATRGGRGVRVGTVASAAAYALGIVGAFCGAGVLLTVAFGAGGVLRMAADPWLNLGITALFLAFALNLLGIYELRLPVRLMSWLGTPSGGHGPGAALILGAAFAVTTFTCTAPFVGTLLVVATRGDWSWPLLGMLVFAGAFALPFFLLALLPDALAHLPRSGEWMLTLRRALGVLEIAAAAKFLSNTDMVLGWGIFTRSVVIAIWAAAALGVALVILGRPGAVHRPGAVPGLARAALILSAIGGAWWIITGLTGARLGELEAFLPPPAGAAAAGPDELSWGMNDFEGSLARARARRRPLFVDFTGYTCTNCRWMEANMFPRPEVRARLAQFERVRLYTDGAGEPYGRQQVLEQQLVGTVALPVYAILTPDGKVADSYVGMTRNSRQFMGFLARGLVTARGH